MQVGTSWTGRTTEANQRDGHWEPKQASEWHALTINATQQSRYTEIISTLKYTSRENSSSKIVPELLTQVREK